MEDIENLPDGEDTKRTALICGAAGVLRNIWFIAIDEVEDRGEYDHLEAGYDGGDQNDHVESGELNRRTEPSACGGECKLRYVIAVRQGPYGEALPLGRILARL